MTRLAEPVLFSFTTPDSVVNNMALGRLRDATKLNFSMIFHSTLSIPIQYDSVCAPPKIHSITVALGSSTRRVPKLDSAQAITERIDEVAAGHCDEDEPPPTEHALAMARAIIRGIPRLQKGFRFAATVVCLDGSIRITWASKSRNVRLVCSAYPATESYVYRERLIGRRATEHSAERATSRALARWLAWLNRSF